MKDDILKSICEKLRGKETKCPACGMPVYYKEGDKTVTCPECGRVSKINFI